MLPLSAYSDRASASIRARAAELFMESRNASMKRIDRLFVILMLVELAAGIAAALWLSPLTWSGARSATHPHVWAALLLGPLVVGFPVLCTLSRPGKTFTRHAVAAGQMLMGGLIIQFTGGRIETHFIVFGSLAFLAFYRDWPVLMTASAIVAVDHIVRGLVWPQSVYGVMTPTIWRSFEHAGWVIFIDIFLITACRQGVRELREVAERRAELEAVNEGIERQILERTAALRASEERFRSLCSSAPIGIFETDGSGACLYTNPFWHGISGLGLEETLGAGWTRAVHAEDRARIIEEWDEAAATGREYSSEFRMVRPDGEVRWVHGCASILRNEKGDIAGYVGTTEDITMRRQTEEALRAAKEAAEAAAKAKSAFLATMSHEIRTPMNGVIGMTGLLLDTELSPEQRQFAETIRVSGQALLTLINDILDFSKIEAGKLMIETLDFDLRITVEEAVELLAERAHAKDLELVSLVQHDVPHALRGDPGRLRQILMNLVGNAVKFTSRGEVSVRARLVEDSPQSAKVRFEVTDTGIGIPPEAVAMLFQPFSQADGSTTRKYGGTGLGLAICKQLVELMNGEIGVESVSGSGSVFWFTAVLEKTSESALALPAPREDLRGVRILIVDDNETNREILSALTTHWGMIGDIASSGAEALEILRSRPGGSPYEIAILDMMMPEMDGIELGRRIRAESSFDGLRLLLLTSSAQIGQGEESRRSGFQGYLTKPVRESLLHDCLRTMLGRQIGAAVPSGGRLVTSHSLRERAERNRAYLLVVEDNEVNQAVAVRILERLGCRADVAANGLEALEALKQRSFDAILMDCQMPEMDGYEATRAIRQSEAVMGGHTPVIAMTANVLQGDREKCFEAGMDDYVPKPIRREDLEAALQKALGERKDGHAAMSGAAPGDAVIPEETLDLAVLEALGASTGEGSDGFLEDLIGEFLTDSENMIGAIRSAIDVRDPAGLARAAHRLKGSSSTMGAKAMASLCARLEKSGREGRADGMAPLMRELTEEFERVRREIARMGAPGRPSGASATPRRS